MAFEFRDLNVNDTWEEGEAIYVTRAPYPATPPAMGSPNPATNIKEFAYQMLINNAPKDTLRRPPTTGTVIKIVSHNALTSGDRYEFSFTPATFDAAAVGSEPGAGCSESVYGDLEIRDRCRMSGRSASCISRRSARLACIPWQARS